MLKVFVVSYFLDYTGEVTVDSVWKTKELAHERAEQLFEQEPHDARDINVQARVLGE